MNKSLHSRQLLGKHLCHLLRAHTKAWHRLDTCVCIGNQRRRQLREEEAQLARGCCRAVRAVHRVARAVGAKQRAQAAKDATASASPDPSLTQQGCVAAPVGVLCPRAHGVSRAHKVPPGAYCVAMSQDIRANWPTCHVRNQVSKEKLALRICTACQQQGGHGCQRFVCTWVSTVLQVSSQAFVRQRTASARPLHKATHHVVSVERLCALARQLRQASNMSAVDQLESQA